MPFRTVPALRRRRLGGLAIGGVVLAGLVALLLAPVELPDRVAGMGRVLPAQEWVLVRTASGAVTATLRDHRTGAVQTTFAAEPARGDAVRFELGPAASQERVREGEVVGTVASGEAALRLAALLGQIEQAEAELRLSGAGSKPEVIAAAREEVRRAEAERARAEAEQARAEAAAARQRELLESGLASEQAVEEAEASAELARAGVAAAATRVGAAAARVRVAQTGARPEEAGVVRARIGALEREAASLQEREALGALVSPIGGRAHRVFSPDTLLLVADTSAYRLLVPVRWSDRNRVRVGARVALEVGADPPLAEVVDVREAAAPRAGQAYLVATAEVRTGRELLVPGLLVPVRIEAEPMTPLAHARRALSDLFAW